MQKSLSARVRLFVESLEDRTTPSANGLLGGLPILTSPLVEDVVSPIVQLSPVQPAHLVSIVNNVETAVVTPLTTNILTPVQGVVSVIENLETTVVKPLIDIADGPLVETVLVPVQSVVEAVGLTPVVSAIDKVLDVTGVSALVGAVEHVVAQTPVGPLVGGVIDIVDHVGDVAIGPVWDGVIPNEGSLPPIPGEPTLPGMPPVTPPFPGVPTNPSNPSFPTIPSNPVGPQTPGSTTTGPFLAIAFLRDDFRVEFIENGGGNVETSTEAQAAGEEVALTTGVVPPDADINLAGITEETAVGSDFTLNHERIASGSLPRAALAAPQLGGWTGWLFGLGQVMLGVLALAWVIHFDRRTPHISTRILRRPNV